MHLLNDKKNRMNRTITIGCVLMFFVMAFSIGSTMNVAATSSWSYSNGMWKGTYSWDATYGPSISVQYKDTGSVWKTAVWNAKMSAVKFANYEGVQIMGYCYSQHQGTHYSYLGGSSDWDTDINGGSGYNYWSIEWDIDVPSTYGVDINARVWFKAEGTTEDTAKLHFGISLMWNYEGICPAYDDVFWFQAFWYIDFDMGDTNGKQQIWTDSTCWAKEAIWDITTQSTGNIIFVDSDPLSDRVRNPKTFATYGNYLPDKKQWGAFVLLADSMSAWTNNDNNENIEDEDDWIGMYVKDSDPGRGYWYGTSVPFKLDLT
jgi:hypothetical protein